MNDHAHEPADPIQVRAGMSLDATGDHVPEGPAPTTVEAAHAIARPLLDREMRDVKDAIIRLGSSVQDALIRAMGALVRHDAEAALAVIRDDARINAMRGEVEDLVILSIATQSPVARDLRYLLMLDNVSNELERIGDYAANVAKQARKLAPEPPLKEYVHLPELGRLAADGANVERGLRIVFAAHYLERAGDRMTNIAEDVVYLATGHMEDLNA
jgi:phosphate uptake regulator